MRGNTNANKFYLSTQITSFIFLVLIDIVDYSFRTRDWSINDRIYTGINCLRATWALAACILLGDVAIVALKMINRHLHLQLCMPAQHS